MSAHRLTRRTFLHTTTVIGALAALSETGQVAARPIAVHVAARRLVNRAPLAQQPFQLLPMETVKLVGWLHDETLLQAHGLGGQMDET